MSLKRLADRIKELGGEAQVSENSLELNINGTQAFVAFDDEWMASINKFYRARQYYFDADRNVLHSNTCAEYLVIRLDPDYLTRPEHHFEGANGHKAFLERASREFLLAYFGSANYERRFERVAERIQRRASIRSTRYNSGRPPRLRPEELFFPFNTIRYKVPRKPKKRTVDEVGYEKVKACLFALAYKKNESWELLEEIKSRGMVYPENGDKEDTLEIPRARYDASLVTYYKVAKSSQFPSQVFLSYYHILEYYFLRVADESVYNAVRARINDPDFTPDYENVSNLLSAISRNDTSSDEKSMLRGVLMKYVSESDFIKFVKSWEEKSGASIFSKKNQKIFGERFSVQLEEGHALANAASILKHIRNALVHSSDRYSRQDGFLPFSESEEVVVRFIPIVKYLAETVIFATGDA